jgi:hypothetical protein
MKRHRTIVLVIIGLLLVAYVGSYLMLSSRGRYVVTSAMGGLGGTTEYCSWAPNASAGSDDVAAWDESHWITLFYFPLYALDRRAFHPDVTFTVSHRQRVLPPSPQDSKNKAP